MTERCCPFVLVAGASSGAPGIRQSMAISDVGGTAQLGTTAFGRSTRPAAGN
jgi:hypothetical protein